jgi:hypothetical protein
LIVVCIFAPLTNPFGLSWSGSRGGFIRPALSLSNALPIDGSGSQYVVVNGSMVRGQGSFSWLDVYLNVLAAYAYRGGIPS